MGLESVPEVRLIAKTSRVCAVFWALATLVCLPFFSLCVASQGAL